jgi:hypothetical protein
MQPCNLSIETLKMFRFKKRTNIEGSTIVLESEGLTPLTSKAANRYNFQLLYYVCRVTRNS